MTGSGYLDAFPAADSGFEEFGQGNVLAKEFLVVDHDGVRGFQAVEDAAQFVAVGISTEDAGDAGSTE